MADGERRMLFDTTGKRRNVIRVVYAVLALLMGTSLFLVVGPFNLGELVGNQGNSGEAADVFHEQAERIEGRLAENPNDEQQLIALTRARINAGNAQIEVTGSAERPTVGSAAKKDFKAALNSWETYLEATDTPNPTVAQLVAGSFFQLAESSTSVREAEENVATATEAQAIAAEQRPNLGSLSTLAIYQLFNGEFAAGDRTIKRAAALAPSKAESKQIEKQLAEYRKNAKQFDQQKQQLAKAEKQLGGGQSQNPFELPGGSGSLAE